MAETMQPSAKHSWKGNTWNQIHWETTDFNLLFQASLTMCLIKSFGLLNKAKIIDAKQATREDLETFHSKEYLDHCDKTGIVN